MSEFETAKEKKDIAIICRSTDVCSSVRYLFSVCVALQFLESARALLDAGEEIPCDLMVTILKFQLQQLEADCQQKREAELASVKST